MTRTVARVGIVLAALYVVVAVATVGWAPGRIRPLFDGFGSHPVEYHWVNPPAEFAERNRGSPGASHADIVLGPNGSTEVASAGPRDGQAQVTVDPGGVPPHEGDSAARLTLTPLDAGTLGPLPAGLRPEGNAYQAAIVYEPSKTPLAEVTKPGFVGLMAAAPADILLFSPDGKAWERLEARPLPRGNGVTGAFTRTGYYVPASKGAPRAAAPPEGADEGGSSAGVVVVVVVTLVVVLGGAAGALALARRRPPPPPPPPPGNRSRKAAKRRR